MIPFEVEILVPPAQGSMSHQARECLLALDSNLRADGHNGRQVLALTFFIDAKEPGKYAIQRECLRTLVREFFHHDVPPTSVVAQAPEGGRHVALEATVLSTCSCASPDSDVRAEHRAIDGLRYAVVTEGDVRQVHAGGISSHPSIDGTAARARDAFAKMEAILRCEGLDFGHVVRQWNYIEGMLDVQADGGHDHQGYQAFNDIRTLAYGGADFVAGYPAATGIGQAAGGVLLEFIALDAPDDRVVALSNPRQTDAHCYSRRMLVGESIDDLPDKSRPKFERAKLVAHDGEEIVFVSGTAAIVGERSEAVGDVAAQTATTIDNIAALVGGRDLSRLRAYVKRPADVPAVRRICEAAFGPIPALYVVADVCRDELLVELEGALVRRSGAKRKGQDVAPVGGAEEL